MNTFRLLLLVNGENRLDLLRVAESRVKPVRGRGSVHNRAGLLCQHPVFGKRMQREISKIRKALHDKQNNTKYQDGTDAEEF